MLNKKSRSKAVFLALSFVVVSSAFTGAHAQIVPGPRLPDGLILGQPLSTEPKDLCRESLPYIEQYCQDIRDYGGSAEEGEELPPSIQELVDLCNLRLNVLARYMQLTCSRK